MDRLGSGILLDPTTGTGSAGAGGVRAWQRRQGAVKMGGEIIFLHLGGRRGGGGRWGAGWGGGRGRKSRGACGARCVRAAPHPSPHPLPSGGAGGLGGGASRWRRGGRQSRTPLLPPPPPPPLQSPLVLQALATREKLFRRRIPRGK